jgi:hypothetical protein
MKSKLFLLTVLLGTTFFFASCCCKKKTTDSTESTTTGAVKINAQDDGKTFHVKKGDTFEATFNECVGCAQIWTITTIDKDKIEVLPNTYSNRSCTNCTGGTQDNTFHLQAKTAGKSELTFTYFDKKVSVTVEAE